MNCNVIEELKPLIKPLNSVKLDPFNARKNHDIDGLALALDELGQHRVVVANKSNGIITLGNGTYKAMQKLGWSHGAIAFVDDDKIDQVRRALSDNKLGDSSSFDNEILTQLLGTFEDPADVPGFSQADLDELIAGVGGALDGLLGDEGEIVEDEPQIDKAEELQQTWQVQTGDLWQLGRHRLICGDCTDKAVIDRLMDGERADLMVTDPPYGVSYASKNEVLNGLDGGSRIQTEIINDHLTIEDIADKLWKPCFKIAHDILSNVSSFYCFMPQGGDQMMMMMMMMNEADLIPRHELIWLKNNHVLGRTDYAYKHEPIIYGWKRKGTHKYYGGFQTSILEFNKPNSSKFHPTMKPIELIAKLIDNSSLVNQLVYDPFLGSGTTLIASHQLNRICYGSELSRKYCAVILQRYADLTGETPIKL